MKLIKCYEIRYRSGFCTGRIPGEDSEKAVLEYRRQQWFTGYRLFLYEINALGEERDITPDEEEDDLFQL